MTPLAAARLVNVALYQAGWFACVLGGASGRPWLGAATGLALVLVHLALVERRADEGKFVALAALAGTAIDSAQQAAGTVAFPSGHYAVWLCPVWLTLLWAQFATLPCHSLAWLAGRPIVSALLGAAGGPLAFLAGERLGGRPSQNQSLGTRIEDRVEDDPDDGPAKRLVDRQREDRRGCRRPAAGTGLRVRIRPSNPSAIWIAGPADATKDAIALVEAGKALTSRSELTPKDYKP